MTSLKQRRLYSNHQDHNKGDSKVVPNNIDPKVPQECPSKRDDNYFEQRKALLQTETQQYMYSQSSKFSSVSRNLIFGIMGTIWAFFFTNGEMAVNNVLLMITLFLCVLYLMLDVVHYFMDSNSYYKEQYKLDKYMNEMGLNKHEKTMDDINKRSHCFIIWKFRVLIGTSFMFMIGLLYQTIGISGTS